MGQELARNALGVQAVRLPLSTIGAALSGPIWADIAHILAPAEQIDGGMTAECAGPLDAPAEYWAQAQHPGLQIAMPVTRDLEVATAEDVAALVDHGRGEGVLVGIDVD